jgi:hypothetical protein
VGAPMISGTTLYKDWQYQDLENKDVIMSCDESIGHMTSSLTMHTFDAQNVYLSQT